MCRATLLKKLFKNDPRDMTKSSRGDPDPKYPRSQSDRASSVYASPGEQVSYTEAQPWIRLVTQYLSTWHQKLEKNQAAVIFFFSLTLPENLHIPSQFWISVTKNITHRGRKTLSRCLLRLCHVCGGWWVKNIPQIKTQMGFQCCNLGKLSTVQVLRPTPNFERDWRKF